MSDNLKQAAIQIAAAFDGLGHRLNLLGNDTSDLWDAVRDLKRALLELRIHELAEHGEVVVVESGMDCDCVQYSGRRHTIQATIEAYEELESDISDWADGPFHLEVVRPSEAGGIRYESRDLVMEAYEDGHRHVIYG